MTRPIASPSKLLLTVVLPVCLLAGPVLAQSPLEPPMAQQGPGQLLFNIRHSIVMGDFPLATRYIQALLGADFKGPDVLAAIDRSTLLRDPDDGLGVLLNRAIIHAPDPEFRKAGEQLRQFIENAFAQASRDKSAILAQRERLTSNLRAREDAVRRLREMAPWSVPLLIDVLWDDSNPELRAQVVVALPRMGRAAVEPLCEALSAPGAAAAKINIVQALVQIGYPHAVPYIQRAAEKSDSEQFKTVCAEAVRALGQAGRISFSGTAGQMFFQLGVAYYEDQPSLRPPMKASLAPIWRFDPTLRGVVSAEAPLEIYSSAMAMRSFARALVLDANQPDAVALWIAANLRKEARLGGQADPTIQPGQPKADYYARAAGPGYLLRALSRAVQDRDAVVALGAVKALGDVGFGHSAGGQAGSLAAALFFPDRRVRYEAALAMATAHVSTRLPEAESVVPILADALGQTGQKQAMALLAKTTESDRLIEQIKAAGYRVEAATTRTELFALARGAEVPHVDLLVVAFETSEGGRPGLDALRADHRFRSAPTLMAATAAETAREAFREVPGVEAIAYTASAADITDRVAALAGQTMDVGMSAAEALSYAIRAASALRDVALSSPQGMDFSLSFRALTRALADSRMELATAAANALTYADDADCQRALGQAALDAAAAPARRVVMFTALAGSAKRFGNRLTGEQVAGVLKAAMEEGNLQVRGAAAEALGALNLPSVQIDALILKGMKDL